MAFTYLHDIDLVDKAKRLFDCFGKSKILIVIRNQIDLIRSFYFECVRAGYPGFFNDFLEYIYFYQFRTIVSDLLYDKVYDVYSDLFGKENIIVIPFERLIQNPFIELSNLLSTLNLSNISLSELSKHNSSDDKYYLQAVRYLNEKFPNNE